MAAWRRRRPVTELCVIRRMHTCAADWPGHAHEYREDAKAMAPSCAIDVRELCMCTFAKQTRETFQFA
ncbi:hypothetical protein PT2222_70275 [Paraburkholderia tropica]